MSDFPAGVALVVGGSGGIGSAVALGLAEREAGVAITYRNHESAAKDVVDRIANAGGRCSAHELSLEDLDSVQRCLDDLATEHGAIHTIVHAAGIHAAQPFVGQVTPEQWRHAIDSDVHGFFHVIHAGLPHLRKSRGSIVLVSSAGLRRFPPGDVLSIAPKGANEALVHAVAREEGRHGVRANNVAVGVVDAGMFPKLVESGELSQEWVDAARKNTPLRRFAKPEEIADAVVFLASMRARYITGQTLSVDGGYTL